MMAKIDEAPRLEQEVAEVGAAHSASAVRAAGTSGNTISLDTIMASATHSTITIAVAADKPPMNTAMLSALEPASIGSASTYMSLSTAPNGKVDEAGEGDRNDEQVDGDRDRWETASARGSPRRRWNSRPR